MLRFDLAPGIALSFLEHLLAVRHLVQRSVSLRVWTRGNSLEKVILPQESGPSDDAYLPRQSARELANSGQCSSISLYTMGLLNGSAGRSQQVFKEEMDLDVLLTSTDTRTWRHTPYLSVGHSALIGNFEMPLLFLEDILA